MIYEDVEWRFDIHRNNLEHYVALSDHPIKGAIKLITSMRNFGKCVEVHNHFNFPLFNNLNPTECLYTRRASMLIDKQRLKNEILQHIEMYLSSPILYGCASMYFAALCELVKTEPAELPK